MCEVQRKTKGRGVVLRVLEEPEYLHNSMPNLPRVICTKVYNLY